MPKKVVLPELTEKRRLQDEILGCLQDDPAKALTGPEISRRLQHCSLPAVSDALAGLVLRGCLRSVMIRTPHGTAEIAYTSSPDPHC